MIDDELLTLRQVAAMLNSSYDSVRRWVRTGTLKAYRLPTGVWRVPRRNALAMLGEHRPALAEAEPARAAPHAGAGHEATLRELRRQGLKV